MSERADQIVLDYLRRVADAAYGVLRSDERLEFLARLRRRIDEVRIRQRAHKPAQVQRIIERFGAPGALVEQERLRLAAERPEDPPRPRQETNRTTSPGEGTSNSTIVSQQTPDRPPNETQPIPVLGASELDAGADYAYVADYSDELEEVPGAAEEAVEVQAAAEPAPAENPEAAEEEKKEPEAAGTRTATPYPRRAAPSDVRAITGRALPGAATARRRADFLDVAARNKLAAVTVVLLGFGALALPVPLWLLGVMLLVLCQAWSMGDKLLGAAVPVLTVGLYGLLTDRAATVLTMSAYTLAGAGGPRLAFGIGGLLGAVYLWFRVSRTTR